MPQVQFLSDGSEGMPNANTGSGDAHAMNFDWYRSLFDYNPNGILLTEPHTGAVLTANPAACRILGYTEAQLCALDCAALFMNDDPHAPAAAATQALTGEFHGELTVRRADGVLLPAAVTQALIPGPNGTTVTASFFLDIRERKANEAALRDSEQRFRLIAELAPAALAVTRQSDETILYVNARTAEMIGKPQAELIGQPAGPYYRIEPEQFAQIVAQMSVTGMVRDLELQITPVNGEPQWVLYSAAMGVYAGEQAALTVMYDITQRKRLEEELRQGELNYRMVTDNMPDVVFAMDATGRLIYVSPSVERIHGFTVEESLAQTRDQRYSAESLPAVAQQLGVCIAEATAGRPLSRPYHEALMRRKDGTTFWGETYLMPRYAADGAFAGFVGVLRDISERKRYVSELEQAHEQVQQTLQQFRLAADAGEIGVWKWRFDDDTVQGDERVRGFYAIPSGRQKLSRDEWRAYVHPDDRARMDAEVAEAYETGQDWHTIFRLMLPDGRIRYVYTAGAAERDPGGAPIGMIGINRDVTDQKIYEAYLQNANAILEQRVAARTEELRHTVAELERANAGKDAFLAAVSHELRTPLTGILSVAETLQAEIRGPLNGAQQRYVSAIQLSGDRLLNMVTSILDYTHAMANTVPQLEPCRMGELCAVAVRAARLKASAKQQSVDLNVDPVGLMLVSDADSIKQILDALLDNAVKFTPKGGRLGVDVAEIDAGVAVQITVWDTGIGISDAHRPYLFEPLTQADQRLARHYDGIGLGLALVKRRVDILGGTIGVESTPGAGSRFIVTLPA